MALADGGLVANLLPAVVLVVVVLLLLPVLPVLPVLPALPAPVVDARGEPNSGDGAPVARRSP